MSDNDTNTTEAPTRRDTVKYGGAVVGGGLLAGCAGQSDSQSTPTEPSAGEESTTTDTSTTEDENYSVTMSPVGTVEFDSVPETAIAGQLHVVDHLVSFGLEDRIIAASNPSALFTGYYEQLPGVSFDGEGLPNILSEGNISKEMLYELDADIHHIDPVVARDSRGFDEKDGEEIKSNIGPFFANQYSRAHGAPDSAADYQYYTLWELAEKYAQVYKVTDRVREYKQIRDRMVSEIKDRLPPKNKRPTVGLVAFYDKNEKFYPYKINGQGFGKSQYRPLGVKDVFKDTDKSFAENYDAAYDYEGMLEYDPDILIQNFGLTYPDSGEGSMQDAVYSVLEESAVAQKLTAVKNDRVYAGTSSVQGPLMNLFQIEIAAKQIYPDEFGEFQRIGNTSEDEQMFDRQRVADIINGDI